MTLFPNITSIPYSGFTVCGEDNKKIDIEQASNHGILFEAVRKDGELRLYITAEDVSLSWLVLRFNCKFPKETIFYGDAWERGYGDLHWSGIVPERNMPWYVLAYNKKAQALAGYGVRVRPNAFCTWHVDGEGITLTADLRCGGVGVELKGRRLEIATVICREYQNIPAFEGGKSFCRQMCDDGIFPAQPVYGSNNWYYAYGNSSREQILSDTDYVAALTEGLENRPFMVIDDGWQKNVCAGPWDKGNEKFGDMKALAESISSRGVKPGIWYRPLYYAGENITDEWRSNRDGTFLDPSHPQVLELVKKDVSTLSGWGYKLIKHDYSSFDMFGDWGLNMGTRITRDGWSFYDRTKTSAEIVLGFYKAIKNASGDSLIMGCNTFSHLCAGLVEINRTGDDTSGREWNRTRNRGVNTLAFRMMQNDIFYKADADCVGITECVPWDKNRQWLYALARSGSPLFISSAKGVADDKMVEEMSQAYAYNSKQTDVLVPVDWTENVCPSEFLLNGEKITFDWFEKHGFSGI